MKKGKWWNKWNLKSTPKRLKLNNDWIKLSSKLTRKKPRIDLKRKLLMKWSDKGICRSLVKTETNYKTTENDRLSSGERDLNKMDWKGLRNRLEKGLVETVWNNRTKMYKNKKKLVKDWNKMRKIIERSAQNSWKTREELEIERSRKCCLRVATSYRRTCKKLRKKKQGCISAENKSE